jgi:hypothetical protein
LRAALRSCGGVHGAGRRPGVRVHVAARPRAPSRRPARLQAGGGACKGSRLRFCSHLLQGRHRRHHDRAAHRRGGLDGHAHALEGGDGRHFEEFREERRRDSGVNLCHVSLNPPELTLEFNR